MPLCTKCGEENSERARFCMACGVRLVVATVRERRKLATMLFCDVTGSTAMGERFDAEAVRALMLRYFDEMRGAIERHGGAVEKFIGDAVVGIFGVPVAHEDDALRAVRAASEMQERVVLLNEEFERGFGRRIALRIGVNTGEVVTGEVSTDRPMASGDPVNVAARLEQAARPGEILVGEQTYLLTRGAVSLEPVEPLRSREKPGRSPPIACARSWTTVRRTPGGSRSSSSAERRSSQRSRPPLRRAWRRGGVAWLRSSAKRASASPVSPRSSCAPWHHARRS